MEYEGVIVSQPPDRLPPRSSQPEPGTEEWFALSREQLSVMLPQCVNKPIHTEHGHTVVGTITSAFYDEKGDAAIRFRFSENDVGEQARSMVDAGVMKGLSLSHEIDSLNVIEVSICFQGARPNTTIKGPVGLVVREETNHLRYKPSVRGSRIVTSFVQASASRVPVMNNAVTPPVNPPSIGLDKTVPQLTPQQMQQFQAFQLFQQQQLQQQQLQQQHQQQPPQQTQYPPTPSGYPLTFQSSPDPSAMMDTGSKNGNMIPMDQAMRWSASMLQAAQGTPFQAPERSGIVSATASTAPDSGVAVGQKRERDDTGVATPAVNVKEQKLSGGGVTAIDNKGATEEDILDAIVQHRGALSNDLKLKLIDRLAAEKKSQMELKKNLELATEDLSKYKESGNAMKSHMVETVIPFMRKILGEQSLNDADEKKLRNAAEDTGAQNFIAQWGPRMVQASSMALAALNRASPESSDPSFIELKRKMEMYNAIKSGRVTAPTSAPSTPRTDFTFNSNPPTFSHWQPMPTNMPPVVSASSLNTSARPPVSASADGSVPVDPSILQAINSCSASDVSLRDIITTGRKV